MRLTERDRQLIQFINTFGFCELRQLEQRFSLKTRRNRQITGRLVQAGFLAYQRLFHQRPGVFRVTSQGARLTDLPPLNRIPLANYEHDLTVIEVALKLGQQYPQATWLSERYLKRDQFANGVGQRGHLPDGVLLFPDGKQIAIEVELTAKGKNRLERILKGYSGQFDIKELWYYCLPPIVASVRSMAVKMPFVTVTDLKTFLA